MLEIDDECGDGTFVRDALQRYHFRMHGGRAYNQDTQHYTQWRWIESMLYVIDMVLEDNEVPQDVRRRVITQIIYGGPDPSEAEKRIEGHLEAVKKAMAEPLLGMSRSTWQWPHG